MDPDEFAAIMACQNANSSFKLFGQSIYFDWSNDKGFQWGNIEGFWGKDKNPGKKGMRFEVALLKEEFTFWGPFGAVVEAKFGTWPITFIVEWQFEIKFDLPAIYSCNTWWGNLLFDNPVAGVYLKPFEWTFWKTPGFGDAGMPQGLPPYRTVDFEWRVRFKPKIKLLAGPDATIFIIRVAFYLDMRPWLCARIPTPQQVAWCQRQQIPPGECIPEPLQPRCWKCCCCRSALHANSSAGQDTPHLQAVDDGSNGDSIGININMPGGVIFDKSELRSLLSEQELDKLLRFNEKYQRQHR